MADDRYRAAFDASIEEVEEAKRVLNEKKKFANMLATMAGIAAPYDDVESPAQAGLAAIRADQFTAYAAPGAAARAYLELRGKEKGAASFEQIAEALKRGGFVYSKDVKDRTQALRVAMGKDEKLMRLPNDAYGLREWYGKSQRFDRESKKKSGAENDEAPSPEKAGESPEPPSAAPIPTRRKKVTKEVKSPEE